MEACFAERHVLWKEIRNGGYIVRMVVMYLGLTYILESYYYKSSTIFFCWYVKV